MAHDRMTNDDLDKKMGAGQEDDFGGQQGKQTPPRNPNDQQTGQKGGQQNKPAGGQEEDYGQGGGQQGNRPGGQGGQNR